MRRLTGLAVLGAGLCLAACAPRAVPPIEAPTEQPRADLRAISFTELEGWSEDDPRRALAAFRQSCASLGRRDVTAAMGRAEWAGTVGDWLEPCAAAASTGTEPDTARQFFETYFIPMELSDRGDPVGLFTGYFEPLLKGARSASATYRVPLRSRPRNLIAVDLGVFADDLEGRRIAGRVEDGRLIPFYSRAEIDAGVLDAGGAPLLWVEDAVAKFFLQIQGSGQVELPDGQRIRVGYADQNGRPYRAIGRDLVEMGELKKEEVSLQSIRAWLAADSARAAELMERNPSYVFFRETGPVVTGTGPVGAQGVPLTAERSIAVDRRFVPLGVPVWLETTAPDRTGERPWRRLMVAQDTGGAIRGVVRGDVFFGDGGEAEFAAGHMNSRGRWFVLVPRTLVPAA